MRRCMERPLTLVPIRIPNAAAELFVKNHLSPTGEEKDTASVVDACGAAE
jgi:hypothetical protein